MAAAVSSGRVSIDSPALSLLVSASKPKSSTLVAASISRAPSSKRTVRAAPLKSSSTCFRSSGMPDGVDSSQPRSRSLSNPSLPSRSGSTGSAPEMHMSAAPKPIPMNDPACSASHSPASGAAYTVTMPGSPASSVHSRSRRRPPAGRPSRPRRPGRDVLGLGDHRPVARDRPARGIALTGLAVVDLREAVLGLVGVLDLDHEHRDRLVLTEVDRGDGRPVAEPGLDVVGVVEVAGRLVVDLVEECLAEVRRCC